MKIFRFALTLMCLIVIIVYCLKIDDTCTSIGNNNQYKKMYFDLKEQNENLKSDIDELWDELVAARCFNKDTTIFINLNNCMRYEIRIKSDRYGKFYYNMYFLPIQ